MMPSLGDARWKVLHSVGHLHKTSVVTISPSRDFGGLKKTAPDGPKLEYPPVRGATATRAACTTENRGGLIHATANASSFQPLRTS